MANQPLFRSLPQKLLNSAK